MQPSPQQLAIYTAITSTRANLLVTAVAGAGKTTTLRGIVQRIPAGASVAFCAYNKAIATEITAKVADDTAKGLVAAKVQCGTFHSFGFRAWARYAEQKTGKKVVVDTTGDKLARLLVEVEVPEGYHAFVKQAVSLAKQRAIGVLVPFADTAAWQGLIDHFELEDLLEGGEGLSEMNLQLRVNNGLNFACRVLRAGTELDTELVDFDDMLYAPLVHNIKLWQNDYVLVDEAQDTNPARRCMAKRMLKAGGRLVAVGDPAQAIYGFTGADNDSLAIIKAEFACTEMPLTVTYRCPKAVVAKAREYVSHITAADSAPEGRTDTVELAEFLRLPAEQLGPSVAVLCRNTKPLVEVAFALIRRRIACRVEGRDIGRSLMALATKWKVRGVVAMAAKLEQYAMVETQRLLAKGQEAKAASLQDRVDTLMVFVDSLPGGATLNDLRTEITKVFADTPDGTPAPCLVLSTVHKSKGREWPTVYVLGRNRFMPSPFARQEWQMQQELNLIYVAFTRAQETLVEVVVPVPVK